MKTAASIFTIALLLAVVIDASCQKTAERKKSARSEKSDSYLDQDTESLLGDARSLMLKNPAEALSRVDQVLAHSIANGDLDGEARAYLVLGEINESIMEWRLALENFTKAYTIFSENGNTSADFESTLQRLERVNLRLKDFDSALKYCQEALQLTLSDDQRTEYLLDLSEIYYQMAMYDESLKVLQKIPSSKVRRSSARSADIRAENQRAKIYARQNDTQKTMQAYTNSLNTVQSDSLLVQDKASDQSLKVAKEEIASALREQKKYDDEIQLRNQAIQYNLNTRNLGEVAKDKVEVSKSLEALGEPKLALKELEEAATLTDTLNDPQQKANVYLSLANAYTQSGQSNKAIAAYHQFSASVEQLNLLNQTITEKKEDILAKQQAITEYSNQLRLELREEKLQAATVLRQQLIIYGLVLIIGFIGTGSFFIYRSAQASKTVNQMLALKSLRSQMNPHFIFNALNSVNHFIAEQDERTANRFLSEFSQLMRLVLEYSQEDFISLQKEQEILTLYMKLEHYRFRDKFDYEINIDPSLNAESIMLPPMLIQPYIENAVWHGLRYRDSKGMLKLSMQQESGNLIVEVSDNGIGRKRSAEIKTENQRKHKSTGLSNIRERLNILNKVYKTSYTVVVSDGDNNEGTKITITIPINSSSQS